MFRGMECRSDGERRADQDEAEIFGQFEPAHGVHDSVVSQGDASPTVLLTRNAHQAYCSRRRHVVRTLPMMRIEASWRREIVSTSARMDYRPLREQHSLIRFMAPSHRVGLIERGGQR